MLFSSGAGATPGAAGPQVVVWFSSGFRPPLPTDGALGFSYTRDPAVTGCSQTTEAEIREALIGVVHTDPFVPAGEAPTFTLRVEMTRPAPALYRATFSLFDATGAPRGVSTVEDETCDGTHLKLLSSIALLLQPRPGAACDAACKASIEEAAAERGRAEVRGKELPIVQEVARSRARREAEEERRRSFRAVVGAGAVTGLHLAAEPAPGFWLTAEARSERWSLGLEVRALLPARAFDAAGGGAIDQATATGLVVPCLRWRWLAGCALVEAGGVFVMGTGTGAGASSGILGLGLRARVDVPVIAGFEARLFGDLAGYPVALDAPGGTGGGASSFEAPRRFAGLVGLGLVRAFD